MPNGNGNTKRGNGNGATFKKRNGNGKSNGNGKKFANPIVPRSRPRYLAINMENSRPVRNRIYKHAGSDFVGTVTVRAGAVGSQRILHAWPISPSAFPGTRLTQFASLYEFFRFTKLQLRYVPAVPVTLACQLCLYVDLDPKDDPAVITNPDALVRQAVAQTGAQQWNFHTAKSTPLAMRTDQQFYFTGEDRSNVRFSQQGVAYLIQITDPVNVNGEPIATDLQAGSIFFDWSVDFNIPQINPEATLMRNAPDGDVKSYILPSPTSGIWEPSWALDPATGKSTLFAPRSKYVLTGYVEYLSQPGSGSGSQSAIVLADNEQVDSFRFQTTLSGVSGLSQYGRSLTIETDDRGIPITTYAMSLATAPSIVSSIGFKLRPLRTGDKFVTTSTTVVETLTSFQS